MSTYLEDNVRLDKLADKILTDQNGEYVKSLNPDLETRRTEILNQFNESVRRALSEVSREEWESIQSDESVDKLLVLLVESILYREDMDKLYFEMGMRSLYLLLQNLSASEKKPFFNSEKLFM